MQACWIDKNSNYIPSDKLWHSLQFQNVIEISPEVTERHTDDGYMDRHEQNIMSLFYGLTYKVVTESLIVKHFRRSFCSCMI